MEAASRNVDGVSGPQHPGLPAARDCHGSGKHLDALILADVDVAGNSSAWVQTDKDAQYRAVSVGAGVQERQVLTGARVVKMLACERTGQPCSAAATKRPSVVVILPATSRRAFARIPGMR